jgi:radical SAM protein with 4Fe4S-binding SPASM domain
MYPEKQDLLKAISVPGEEASAQIDPADYILPTDEYRARLDKPVSLMLMPTDKCLTDCIYCYACRRAVDTSRLLKLKRIDQLMDEARSIGVCLVNLDGGDLFAREEHIEIVSAIAGRGMGVGISTKARISKEKARQIYDSGVRWIQVGLDAPTKEMAAYLVNRSDYLDRTVETIRNLAEAGIRTRTNSIIVRETLHLLPDLVDLLMTLPLMNIKIAPAFRSIYRGGEDMLLTLQQKTWYKEQMRKAEEKYPDRTGDIQWECREDSRDMSPDARAARFSERPLCSSGRTQIIITPDGKVVTCEQSPQTGEFVCGDCSVQSIEEVWNSKELEAWYKPTQEKFRGTACYDCADFSQCIPLKGQCWLHAYRAYGSPYAPDPDCRRAPLLSERWD